MAPGRAARMGGAMAGTGAVLGFALDRRRRTRTPRRIAGVAVPTAPALEQALEGLAQAAEAARPRVGQAGGGGPPPGGTGGEGPPPPGGHAPAGARPPGAP